MTEISSYLSMIILNVNKHNKEKKMTEFKKDLTTCCI